MATPNQLATQNANRAVSQQGKIKNLLTGDYFKQQVAMCLPKHLTPERFIRIALTALMRVPRLAECTEASLLRCLLDCSALGIEPDGRRAHLIPFANRQAGTVECTLIIDWKGLVELAWRSGKVTKIHADILCENDEFAYDLGDILHHRVDWRNPRGEAYGAYALAVLVDGQKLVAVMTRDEIEKIRNNSQGWRAFKSGYTKSSPWQDAESEMWKKTAIRRLAKWLPLSPEERDSLDREDVPIDHAPLVNMLPALTPAGEAAALEQGHGDPAGEPGEAGEPGLEPEQGQPEQGEPEPPQQEPPRTQPIQSPATARAERKLVLKPTPPQKAPQPGPITHQRALCNTVTDSGFTFDQFKEWSMEVGMLPNADTYGSFDDIPDIDAKRVMRSEKQVIQGMINQYGNPKAK